MNYVIYTLAVITTAFIRAQYLTGVDGMYLQLKCCDLVILYAICEKEGYNKWITLSTLSLSQCWVRKTIDQFLHVIAESVEFQKDWPRVFSQKNVRDSPVAFLLDSRRALLELFSHRIGRRAMFWCLVECRELAAWRTAMTTDIPMNVLFCRVVLLDRFLFGL
ncbi:unnamed protein product [Albugo candida]|uniref:Uncharacterized protein n=1 Tax=Albugo candida TaxID=65357 RepID=A0A024GFT0_9STRA|nr:unnamed protein product [Albugo candida]|eukprot:CCI45198.1 unnamed protein product [Albugo candida]